MSNSNMKTGLPFPEFMHTPASSFRELLRLLDEQSGDNVQKGTAFEQLVKAFLESDKAQSGRFERVWLWGEWPGNQNRHDYWHRFSGPGT